MAFYQYGAYPDLEFHCVQMEELYALDSESLHAIRCVILRVIEIIIPIVNLRTAEFDWFL